MERLLGADASGTPSGVRAKRDEVTASVEATRAKTKLA
jgi:hypothetical protein